MLFANYHSRIADRIRNSQHSIAWLPQIRMAISDYKQTKIIDSANGNGKQIILVLMFTNNKIRVMEWRLYRVKWMLPLIVYNSQTTKKLLIVVISNIIWVGYDFPTSGNCKGCIYNIRNQRCLRDTIHLATPPCYSWYIYIYDSPDFFVFVALIAIKYHRSIMDITPSLKNVLFIICDSSFLCSNNPFQDFFQLSDETQLFVKNGLFTSGIKPTNSVNIKYNLPTNLTHSIWYPCKKSVLMELRIFKTLRPVRNTHHDLGYPFILKILKIYWNMYQTFIAAPDAHAQSVLSYLITSR